MLIVFGPRVYVCMMILEMMRMNQVLGRSIIFYEGKIAKNGIFRICKLLEISGFICFKNSKFF